VEGIIDAIFFNQGHVCCAGSRLFVQESIADIIIQKLKDRMETLIVGDPLDKNTDIGAINSEQQYQKINEYLKLGVDEGADMYQSECLVQYLPYTPSARLKKASRKQTIPLMGWPVGSGPIKDLKCLK